MLRGETIPSLLVLFHHPHMNCTWPSCDALLIALQKGKKESGQETDTRSMSKKQAEMANWQEGEDAALLCFPTEK